MRNRAKCKLCGSVLESFHRFDYVTCQCGEIGISGGAEKFESSAKDYSNFLRVMDNDREIGVKFINEGDEEWSPEEKQDEIPVERVYDKKERLDNIIKHLEDLPGNIMTTPLTHYDMLFLVRLMREEG